MDGGATISTGAKETNVVAYLDRFRVTIPPEVPEGYAQWAEFPGAKLVTSTKAATFTTKIPTSWPYSAMDRLAFNNPKTTTFYEWARAYGQVRVLSV